MKLIETDFTNELGRAIILTIDTVPVVKDQPTHLSIKLAGPDSTSENIMTLGEAVQLRNALNNVLK